MPALYSGRGVIPSAFTECIGHYSHDLKGGIMNHIIENKHFQQAYRDYWEGIKCYRQGTMGRPIHAAAQLRYMYRILAGK